MAHIKNDKQDNKEKIIEWGDKQLVVHSFEESHANGGRLEKFWAEDIKTGRQFLIKGNSLFSFEPFSEKLAYIIGKCLGIDVLEYDIIEASKFKGIISLSPFCKYVSICEKIDRKNYSITSVAEIKRAKNVIKKPEDKSITNREVMYDTIDRKYIDTMLFFDAMIGNVDRHYGNVHILRGVNGEMIGAPILDNGASLLAQQNSLWAALFGDAVGEIEFFNRSSTIANTHTKQLETIESLKNINFNIPAKTIQILNEIQPVLDMMPKLRAKVVKRYIVYRLHKYLGMLKEDTKYRSPKLKPLFETEAKNEKEHT